MINYPTSIDALSNPASSDLMENATAALDHNIQHANANDAIEALEAKVGADSSAVTTSHDYKLGEILTTDKAVGKTATQTLTNKTLSAPAINMGSDATGDTYYRTAGGAFARLPIGTSGQILQTSASAIPEWIANPAAADASTTVKGVGELSTSAEINAGTATGGTGAALLVTPDQLAASNYITSSRLKFGGTGADGALAITSGTTTIDCANAAIVVKNYTSVSITGTGKLAFSNPHANGTIIIIKSQGAVTLTSSQAPMIDVSGMGAAGGTGGAQNTAGTNGSNPNFVLDATNHYGIAGAQSDSGDGGVIYDASTKLLYITSSDKLFSKALHITPGAGGGGGCGGTASAAAIGGNGGRGGGGLIIECAGAINFTTASGISVNGSVGSDGAYISGAGHGGGAGGGGAAGMAILLYNTLTSVSGTITSAGGTGGTGGNGSGGGGTTYATGGGGAGAYGSAGGAGGTGGNPGGAGTAAAGVGAGGGGGGGGSGSGGGAGGAGGSNQASVTANNLYFT